MPGSPCKKRGESQQTGAKPGATGRRWSALAAERPLRRTFVRLEKMRRWRDELAATEDAERFLPTRPGAQTTRARKNRAAPLGMTGVVGWCRVPRPHGLRRFASQA